MSKQANLLNYQAWLFKARGDLKASKSLLKLAENDEEYLANAIYLTQQCAEKALKAYLAFKKQPLQKMHNLIKLLEECSRLEPGFSALREKALLLDPYATQYRYPDDYLMPEIKEVVKAVEAAEQIFEYVRKQITYESHPNLKLFIWLLMFLGWKGGW